MEKLLHDIEVKKAELDRRRPLSAGAIAQIQKYYVMELTHASNAIEGNAVLSAFLEIFTYDRRPEAASYSEIRCR
jgi:hypothetical protein